MFPGRMARKPPIFGLLWLFTLSYVVAAGSLNLSTDFSPFIPVCAEQCFLSFVNVNYGVSTCGHTPSRDCLCTRASASGFTIGEGAVQCITAERAIHFCSADEASNAVVREAFYMCNDVDNAIQVTHGTITATLVLPPPGGNGIVTVPFPETTSIPTLTTKLTTSTTSTSSRTSTTSTRSRRTTDETTTFRSSTTTSLSSTSSASDSFLTTIMTSTTQTSTTESDTPVGTPDGAIGNKDDSDELSKGQVVGISVGVAAAAGVAVAAILLSRYYRKKKFPNVKTAFLPRRSTWGYKVEKGSDGGSDSWIAQQITAPLDPNSPPPMPKGYNHRSWRPSTIGLAISKPQNKEAERMSPPRRFSRLLPAKPILPLNLPRSDSPPLSQQIANLRPPPAAFISQPTAQNRAQRPAPPRLMIPTLGNLMAAPPSIHYARESTMTEFEEDGASSLQSAGGQVWRPPPTTPLSATTYYVADKQGNWVLGNSKRASQMPEVDVVSPITAMPKTGVEGMNPVRGPPKDDRPPPPPKEAPSVLAPPAEIIRSSSVYSQQSNVPRPLFSSTMSNPRGSSGSGIRRSLSRPLTRPRAESTDSGITTFTTSSEDTDDPSPPVEPQPLQGNNLSPVAESPGSGSGRSPVTYPRIPGREPSVTTRRANNPNNLAPPAPPPTAASRTMAYYPPGQPSPTLGMVLQQQQQPPGPGLSSYNVPRRGRQAVENPGLLRTGSPTMRVVEPSPEPDARAQLPSARPNSRVPPYSNHHWEPQYPRHSGAQEQTRPQPPYPYQQPRQQAPYYSYQQQQPPRQELPRQQAPQQQGPYPPFLATQPPANRNPDFARPPLHPLTTVLHPPPPPRDPLSVHGRSPTSARTDSTASSLLAKRLGSDRAAGMSIHAADPQGRWRGDENGLLMTPGRPDDLPSTPTWVPKLTPTRRGDDLFLDVR